MQSNALSALLNSDIQDPTDFPNNEHAPGLRQLDAALRCDICSEFYEAPVTLTCGHCFCSLCARSYISEKSECPSCRKMANEGHLRSNVAMEEVVTQWKRARGLVLKFAKAEESRLTDPPKPDFRTSRIGKRKRSYSQDIPTTPTSDGIEFIGDPSNYTVKEPARRRREELDEDEVLPTILMSDSRGEESGDDEQSGNGFVTCPICNTRVKEITINAHIDNNCKDLLVVDGKGKQKLSPTSAVNQWSKIMSGAGSAKKKIKSLQIDTETEPDEPLPTASYAVLKERQIKEMLSEHKLSTTGERNVLIARHSRWVMIYNANLNKSQGQRRSIAELQVDLKKWDEQQRMNAKKREKERDKGADDAVTYQKTHKSEFARLVEAAKSSRKKASGELSSLPERLSSVEISGLMAKDNSGVVDWKEDEMLDDRL